MSWKQVNVERMKEGLGTSLQVTTSKKSVNSKKKKKKTDSTYFLE